MANTKTSRMAWGLAIVLVIPIAAGIGFLLVRLRPYGIAKYRGRGADLRQAMLPIAPLARADLAGANLAIADLTGANLFQAHLSQARLAGATLAGANLLAADL